MQQDPSTEMISKVLVIRVLPNMVNAISTQGIHVIAFGVEDGIANQDDQLVSDRLSKDIVFFPENLVQRSTLADSYKYILFLGKIIRTEKPDIVHVNALQDLFLTLIAVLAFSPPKRRPKIIAMSHNPAKWKDSHRAWLGAKAIEFFTDGFICLATSHKNQLINLGVPSHKIIVIPNPYELEQIELISAQNERSGVKGQKDYQLIYVANICRRKAQDILIRAAARVIEQYPEVTFHFVGRVIDGEEDYAESLHSLQKELRINGGVRFTGQLAYGDALETVRKSDIFVFPSYSEMMPRAVIEAMVLGKPIVASSVDGILDLIDHRKTGLLVEPGNPEKLACAIIEIIENPFLAADLGSNAQKYISVFCSPERVGKSLLDFYHRIRNQK